MRSSPPVLRPVVPGAPFADRVRPPRWGIALAAGLALVVAVSSAILARHGGGPEAGDGDRASEAPRFGAGTEARVAALRDRLAAGLLALKEPDGHWTPRPLDGSVEPVHEAEATAFGLLGLAAARRMGSSVPGISPAIDGARAWLAAHQRPDGGFGGTARGGRAMGILAVSTAVLGWVLAGEAADGAALDAAAGHLAHEFALGPLPDGWTRGVATMALSALAATGTATAFGDDPLGAVQSRDVGAVRDSRDPLVAEALARVIRARGGATDSLPGQILAKAIEMRSEWAEDRTDLYSWVLRAWLASRVEGGERWFAGILPELERAPGPDGSVPGDFYGYPASRTACALLILLEGMGLRRPFGGP